MGPMTAFGLSSGWTAFIGMNGLPYFDLLPNDKYINCTLNGLIA